MKTFYYCETCGKRFTDFSKCMAHEKICKEKHAAGIKTAEELNSIIESAVSQGVKLGVENNDKIYKIDDVVYNPTTGCVAVVVDFDNRVAYNCNHSTELESDTRNSVDGDAEEPPEDKSE